MSASQIFGVASRGVSSAIGFRPCSMPYPVSSSAAWASRRYSAGLPSERCTATARSCPMVRSMKGTRAASTIITSTKSLPTSPHRMPMLDTLAPIVPKGAAPDEVKNRITAMSPDAQTSPTSRFEARARRRQVSS